MIGAPRGPRRAPGTGSPLELWWVGFASGSLDTAPPPRPPEASAAPRGAALAGTVGGDEPRGGLARPLTRMSPGCASPAKAASVPIAPAPALAAGCWAWPPPRLDARLAPRLGARGGAPPPPAPPCPCVVQCMPPIAECTMSGMGSGTAGCCAPGRPGLVPCADITDVCSSIPSPMPRLYMEPRGPAAPSPGGDLARRAPRDRGRPPDGDTLPSDGRTRTPWCSGLRGGMAWMSHSSYLNGSCVRVGGVRQWHGQGMGSRMRPPARLRATAAVVRGDRVVGVVS